MTPADCLLAARALLVRYARLPATFSVPHLLLAAADGDREVMVAAHEALDAATADGLSFQMWCDGGTITTDGESFGVTYRYDRTVPEIAAAMGRVALRLAREAA